MTIFTTVLKRFCQNKHQGQGVIEYAGAIITATVIVAVLVSGSQQGQFMYNAYQSLFDSTGKVITDQANSLNTK